MVDLPEILRSAIDPIVKKKYLTRHDNAQGNTNRSEAEDREINSEAKRPPEFHQSSRLINPDNLSGNYMFTFGFPSAGKSTFQCYLTRYLLNGREDIYKPSKFSTEYSTNNPDAQRLTNEWRKTWKRNEFPEPTPARGTEIRKLQFKVKPLKGVRRQLEFSFIEASGELFRTVSPEHDHSPDPHLSNVLSSYLRNTRRRFIIVLIVDPERGEQNDRLFYDFIEFLRFSYGSNFADRTNLLLLVPKPEIALGALKTVFREIHYANELNNDLSLFYVQHFLKSTWGKLETWPTPPFVSRFSLGSISKRGPDSLDPVDATSGTHREYYISKLSLEDCEKIFSHIYSIFTGKKLGPGAFVRLFIKLKDWLSD